MKINPENIRNFIEANYPEVKELVKKAERQAMFYTNYEFTPYIDSDGEMGIVEELAGSTNYHRFSERDYDRYYFPRFCYQFSNLLWEYWFAEKYVAKDIFEEKFGIELNTEPVDEDGYEIRESLYENMVRQLAGTKHEDELEIWLEEQTEEAIKEAQFNAEIDKEYEEYIEDFIKHYEI